MHFFALLREALCSILSSSKPTEDSMKRSLLFLIFPLMACAGANKTPESKAPAGLAGKWQSGCVNPGNNQAIQLNFDLTASDWKLDYIAFADATCTTKNLTVHIEGAYALGKESTVTGAKEGRFDFATKTVTPHSEGAAAFLSQACGRGGFTANTPADLKDGCAGLGAYPISSCPSDFDLVFLEGDTLSFGARPADNNMCTPEKRPTSKGLTLKRS
jgi:hypothetical protein